MDQSELKFKFRKNQIDTSIPDDKLSIGEYYINTGSSYMYLKTSDSDGLIHPAIIYDTDAEKCDIDDDTRRSTDSYLGSTDTRFIVFEKLGANKGRFIPMSISSSTVVTASLCTLNADGSVTTTISDSYKETAYKLSQRSNSKVIAVIGYYDSIYKESLLYGSSAIVELEDITEDGSAKVKQLLGGYILLDSAISESNISFCKKGMAWKIDRTYYVNNNGTIEAHNAPATALCLEGSGSNCKIEIHSPYMSIINKTIIFISGTTYDIYGIGDNFTSHAKVIITSTAKNITYKVVAGNLFQSWLPPTGISNVCDEDGNPIFNHIPTQGNLQINSNYIISADMLNTYLFAGWKFFDKTLQLNAQSNTGNADDDLIDMLKGIHINSNMNLTTNTIFLCSSPTDQSIAKFKNVPVSLIQGNICSCISSITDMMLEFETNSDNKNVLTRFSNWPSNEMIVINNIAVCNAGDVLGGEDFVSDASDVIFIMIDYQSLTKDMTNTATKRAYIRCEDSDKSNYAYMGKFTIGSGTDSNDIVIYLK